MRAYVYAGPGRKASAAVIDLAELWDSRLLDDSSTVWINTASVEPVLWALTSARSTLIYVHRCADPGYVRLTSGRARWARTHDGTRDNPRLDLNFSELPGDADGHTTLVVAHRSRAQRVGIIDNSRRAELSSAGSYTHGAVTVIDLAAYRAAHAGAGGGDAGVEVSQFVRANAAYNGLRVLAHGLPESDAELIRQHPDAFEFDIGRDSLEVVCKYLADIDTFADGFQALLVQRLDALQGGVSPGTATA